MRCLPSDVRPLDLVVSTQRDFDSRDDHGRAVWIAKCLGTVAAPLCVGSRTISAKALSTFCDIARHGRLGGILRAGTRAA